MEITKEVFMRFENLRISGRINMVMPDVKVLACITKEQHLEIIRNYNEYAKEYLVK